MNNNITLHLPQPSVPAEPPMASAKRLLLLVLALGSMAWTGCFRATGMQRTVMVAETIPESGGDRVSGLKSKGGSGNLYLGNDFIQLVVDNQVYGDTVQTPMAGAASGGSIVDAGYISLDGSYARVGMPGTAMNRLTPVVNQDPELPLVFTTYGVSNTSDRSMITMTGGLLDSTGKLGSAGLVSGVSVTHTIAVTQLERYFTLTTTVTNHSGSTLAIRNVGDCLLQQEAGGYAFNVPANFDYQGNTLATRWGVQIPSYTDFTSPLKTSVQAAMVGLMDLEPSSDALDSHCSLGILPVDAEQLLVAADPQDLLALASSAKPSVPTRLVAGSLPIASTGLADGDSITYHRRLFIVGGTSVATNIVGGLSISANYPAQATGLFNLMDTYRYNDDTIRPVRDFGQLTFTMSGMSQRQGPDPTEIRIERNMTASSAAAVSSSDTWQVQRVEWFEPNENLVSTTALATSSLQVRLPVGVYRMVLTSVDRGATPATTTTYTQTRTLFQNTNVVASSTGDNQAGTLQPIWIQKDQDFKVSTDDILSPIATTSNANLVGTITSNPYSLHYFTTREENSPTGNLQPLRITFKRTDTAVDPLLRRMRTLGSHYDPINKEPAVSSGSIPGQYQIRAGNEMFGTGFTRLVPSTFAWFPNGGTYTAYGTRGPLADILSLTLKAADGATGTSHTFLVSPQGLPPNWTSFDLPGPGQATTGGYLPGEKLTSAMANGVQVVGHTEMDLAVNAPLVYSNWRAEFGSDLLTSYTIPASLSDIDRPTTFPYGFDPFVVGGRTSSLTGYGDATSLFTPDATSAPLGGATPFNSSWTLADFIAQAGGEYVVLHRPYGPSGAFTLKGAPDPTDTSNWWNLTGSYSLGKTQGSIDALELLRGEGLDASDPSAWFAEFLKVRTAWFSLLNHQSPAAFTKALGLSSAKYSLDTPTGLARTYLKAHPTIESDLSGVLSALKSGAAVASTGPFLDVSIGGVGPGGTVAGPVESVTLTVNLWKTDALPVDQIRVVVNGSVVQTIDASTLSQSTSDTRLHSGSYTITLPSKDSWIVVEAGVPLATTGVYASGTAWNYTMRGIYPIAVSNPIFVDVLNDGYPAS